MRACAYVLLVAASTWALNTADLLLEAQRRRCSNARAAFAAAVRDPMLKDPTYNPTELVSLIAAEERCTDTSVLPQHVSADISSRIEQLVAPAAQRLQLDRSLGSHVGPKCVASAVASAMFGNGSPDDASEAGFFRPVGVDPFTMPEEDIAEYYNPQNLFLDSVLERRKGVPVAMSIIAADACSQLGVPMVGLATPTSLLLAPAAQPSKQVEGVAAAEEPFLLDCSTGAGVLSEDEAAAFIAADLCDVSGEDEAKVVAVGRKVLRSMRASPLTALQWGATVLRNLHDVHEDAEDVVRLLGVCDRLRLIGSVSRLAVPDEESREYAEQVALCIYKLRWQQRRNEAKILLNGLLKFAEETGASALERARLESLLGDPWFADNGDSDE